MSAADYAGWIARDVFLSRMSSEPKVMARTIRLFAAGTAQIEQNDVRMHIFRRLLEDSILRQAVIDDPMLREAFATFLTPIRTVSGLEFDRDGYLYAAALAHRGEPALLNDRSGRTFELREMSLIDKRVTGLGITANDTVVVFDADWRRLVPHAPDDELEPLLRTHRTTLEMSAEEIVAFASDIARKTPIERMRAVDNVISSLTSWYIEALRTQLPRGVFPEQLVPTPVQRFDRHVGLGECDGIDIETMAQYLLSRCTAITAFERLSGLPMRMPTVVIDRCISEIGTAEDFVHLLMRTSGTPVSLLHTLRIVDERLEPCVAQRLSNRIADKLTRSLESSEIGAYIFWIQSIADELLHGEESREWPSSKRFVVAWIYGHQTMRVLIESGYSIAEARETRFGLDCHDEMFAGAPEDLLDPLNPRLVGAAQLLVSGMADALTRGLSLSVRTKLRNILHSDFEPLPWNPTLYHAIDEGSWLDGNRLVQMHNILGEQFTESDEATFSLSYLEEAMGRSATEPIYYALVSARLAALEPPTFAVEWLRGELDQLNPRTDLLDDTSLLWRVRLVALSRLALMSDDERTREKLRELWAKSLAAIAQADESTNEEVMAIVEMAGYLARTESTYVQRVATFSNSLLQIALASPRLTRAVGPMAGRLLKRLAPSVLTADLSRTALLARFRGT